MSATGTRDGLGGDFWLYFTGQLISQLGGSFTLFAIPLIVFELTGSAANLAYSTVADLLPYLLFGLVIGALLDRVDRRALMLATDLARGVVICVIPILALVGELRIEAIYAVAFIQATLGIAFTGGAFAALPSLVSGENLVTANGRIMATNFAGQVAGPALAGVLVTIVPVADLLFVDAASFAVSSLSLALIGRSFNGAPNPGAARESILTDIKVGLAYVWSQPVLRTISIMMALINFVGATESSQLVLFAKRALHATNSETAILFAAGAAGVVVVSLAAAPIRRRTSFATCALGALVISGLATTAMGLIDRYPAALVCWAASAGFGMLLNINTSALRQVIVPNELFGRVVTIAGVLAWSAIPLGALAGAAAIHLTRSVTGVYAAVGALTALIALAFAFSPIRDGDRYLAEAEAETTAGQVVVGDSGAGSTG